MDSPNIFIGYRRGDGAGWAGRLHADLRTRLGSASHIFMDVDGIPPGEDFRAYIDGAIGQCDAFVALIGPNWLDARDEHGRRRLDDPHDFVRLEVAAALRRNIRVIPVLVGGARLPTAEELPEPLGRLVDRHAVSLDNETWDLGVSKIVGSFVERSDPALPRLRLSTRQRDLGTRAVQQPRPHPISGLVLIVVVMGVLAIGVGAAVLGRSWSQSASVATTAPPAPTQPLPTATSTLPPETTSSPETTASHASESTSSPETTASPQPGQVVKDYYDAINARDYQTAWALVGGNKFGQTYEEFATGFQDTVHDDLRIISVNGSTVTIELIATHRNGSIHTYQGNYIIRAGRIVRGDLRRVG